MTSSQGDESPKEYLWKPGREACSTNATIQRSRISPNPTALKAVTGRADDVVAGRFVSHDVKTRGAGRHAKSRPKENLQEIPGNAVRQIGQIMSG